MIELPEILTSDILENIFEKTIVVKESVFFINLVKKKNLSLPLHIKEEAEIKQFLEMLIPEEEEKSYSQKFIKIFCFIKLNSLLSSECSINTEFIEEFVKFLNSNKILHIRHSKTDEEIFSQVLHSSGLYKYLSISALSNIMVGQCFLATTLFMMILESECFLKKAEVNFALSYFALRGKECAFISKVHEEKNHFGETNFEKIHFPSELTQDPYSIRCGPQVYGVVYECIDNIKNYLNKILNQFHFLTLEINGKNYHNLDLYSDCGVLKGDFLVCSLNEIGSMSFLKSERILNSYLSKNSLEEEEPQKLKHMRILMKKVIHCVFENKLISIPSNIDTMNINNYNEDIFYTSAKIFEKFENMMKNLYEIMLLEVHTALEGIQNIYHLGKGPIFQNPVLEKEFEKLKENCMLNDKQKTLNFLKNSWIVS